MNMDIYNVTVCKFTAIEQHDCVQRLITDEYIKCQCLIDFENSIATNIFTGEQFYILKKDSRNRILCSEKDKIVLNKNYGVGVSKIKLKTLSKKEQIKLTLEYLKFSIPKSKKEKQSQKVIKR